VVNIRKSDKNQAEIVKALREYGASVADIHEVGRDIPDILAGFRGQNYLFEIKAPGGKLKPGQVEFQKNWHGGRVHVVHSPEEAIEILQEETI
jgi:Holliday junction resolvase